MARNSWTETRNELDFIYRYTISLGKGLVKIKIHKIDREWADEHIKYKADRERVCDNWLVHINKVRILTLDGSCILSVKNNCLNYVKERVSDITEFLQ